MTLAEELQTTTAITDEESDITCRPDVHYDSSSEVECGRNKAGQYFGLFGYLTFLYIPRSPIAPPFELGQDPSLGVRLRLVLAFAVPLKRNNPLFWLYTSVPLQAAGYVTISSHLRD